MFRLAIFVDGAYLEKVAAKNDVWVDYGKLSDQPFLNTIRRD